MKKFYVTTPIYYPNDIPHLGHAYTTISADVLSRWNKLQKNKVFFLTGTDEHGKKIEESAKKLNKTPKEFTDSLVLKFKEDWKKLNIQYDVFMRTTDKSHENVVQEILNNVNKKGDIYLGKYEGHYCVACEAYYTERDSPDLICPVHKRPLEKLSEPSYFFKLSKYQKKLIDHYKKNKSFILPKEKSTEIINRLKEGLHDLSISRSTFTWGIPLPFDKKHIAYVWFDALINYYSATREKKLQSFWPADVHIVGKDILWFHSVIWPAILMSAEIKLPKTIFSHGWWTIEGEKMGKSAGNAISIDQLIEIAGVDSARYFLMRETPFGEDGDFSKEALIERNNNELANKLGNLVSRVSTLAEKYGLEKNPIHLKNQIDNFELDKSLQTIFSFIDKCNEYIQENKPWETKDKKILYELSNAIKDIAILLYPFIPETSEKIAKVFNFKISLKDLKEPLKVGKINKAPVLFSKI